jgi:hypothetical protein
MDLSNEIRVREAAYLYRLNLQAGSEAWPRGVKNLQAGDEVFQLARPFLRRQAVIFFNYLLTYYCA